MGWKGNIFKTASLFLCNLYYKKTKQQIHFSRSMAYDSVKEPLFSEYYPYDYCRCRALELVAEEIYRNNISGNVAEAGVSQGDFSRLINSIFPDRKLYLYDTFEGFNESDKKKEIEKGYTTDEFFNYNKDFKGYGPEKNMENVRLKMKYIKNCVFRKGYFPESAITETEETFAFVSLDMDLYEPIFNGLQFFYPRLSKGGYIFLHDYNHKEFKGIQIAVENFEKINGKINRFPLPDQGGTLVIVKS